MTLGWYCGSDAFGPYDHTHYDITHCFQSLTILLPPSLFMVFAFVLRMARIQRYPPSSLLLDPLPRFPQIISACLALLALCYLVFFVLQDEMKPYRIIFPALSFVAWTLSLVLLRFEHSRALPISPYGRVFYFLSFIASAKQAESSVMNFVFNTPVMAFDILVFLHLFLSLFMLRYAITGVGDSSHLSINWQEDLEANLVDEHLEEDTSPVADRSMWKRFLNFSHNDDDPNAINAAHSLNSDPHSAVRSSLDVRDDRNPFAAQPPNPFEDPPVEETNPFSDPTPTPAPLPPPRDPSLSTKVKLLTAALREAHLLAGATVSLPSSQDTQVAGRTVLQYQLHIQLHQPSIVSGDPDVDAVTAWKRYREFEGLHTALTSTARKYNIPLPDLPPAPKRRAMEEGRARLEAYLQEVLEQPLFWDDVSDFAGVKERVEYIAGYMQQVRAQREQERRAKEEAVLQAVHAAEAKKREREARAEGRHAGGGGPAQANGAVAVVKVQVERPQGLDYRYQIVAVRVSGWSRWMGEGGGGGGGEEDGVERGGKAGKGSRSALTSPAPNAGRRKGGSAQPSLSASAFYLTFDFPVKTSVGDYTVYHTLQEVADFRAELVRHFQATQPSLCPSIPALVVGRGVEGEGAGDEEMLATASGVEVFFQSLITTTAFQVNLLYAFMERRKPRAGGNDTRPSHLVSGQKPLATYDIAGGEWRAVSSAASSTAGSKAVSPQTSVPASPVGRRRKAGERKEAPVNAPLFPEAAAPVTPGTPSQLSPHGTSPGESTGLSASLTSASPLGGHASHGGDASTSHRFSVSIPSYSHANPADVKSHILYSIDVREYFSLTSFIEWQVTRRYRDFEQLHQALQRLFQGYAFPPLPAKRRTLRGKKEGELEQRRQQLELYLQQVINVTMFQVDEFFDFFDLKNANRQFTVGTQVKAVEPVGELEGVREGGNGVGEEDDGGREEVKSVRSGRRTGNGTATPDRRDVRGAEGQGSRARTQRTRQPPAQPTNPFDF